MKQILLPLAGLLLTGSAQAQFGVRAGVSAATLSTKSDDPYRRARADGRMGYQLGWFYEHKLTSRWSVVPEVVYSHLPTQLSVEDYTLSEGGYTARYQLNRSYLNVPMLVRSTFGPVYLEAGLQASFLLIAHEKGTETIGMMTGRYEFGFDRPATDRYRRFDVGLCAGVGVKLPAGFELGVRASTGLLSIAQPYKVDHGYGGNLKSQVVQASVGYQFKPRS